MKTNTKLFLIGLSNILIWLASFSIYIYYYKIDTGTNNSAIQFALYGVALLFNIYFLYRFTTAYKKTKALLVGALMPILGYLLGIGIVFLDICFGKVYSMLIKWAVAEYNDWSGYASLAIGLTGLIFLAIIFIGIIVVCALIFLIQMKKIKHSTSL